MSHTNFNVALANFPRLLGMVVSGADPETLLTGGGGSGAMFSIIDATNCSPKTVLACRSVNLVFISFSA